MTSYVVRRLLYVIPTLLGIMLLAFLLLQFVPGDPARQLAGQDADATSIQNIRHQLGLDQPKPIQFVSFVAGAVHGDFGRSFVSGQPVRDEVVRRYPRTLILAASGLVLSLVLGIALGIGAALKPYSFVDGASMVVALAGISLPGFWLGLMLIYLFAVQLRLLPTVGLENPQSLILPAFTISLYSVALIARLTRAGMLEVLGDDYVRTARSKGLAGGVVVFRHALRNVLMPVLAAAGISFGYLLSGSVVVEVVFSINGMGSMIVQGILSRDMPIVETGVMVVAANFVLINLAMDLIQVTVDPRLRV